jgi:excisionase family DNA binding protein
MSAESGGLDDSFLTVAEVAAILKLNQQTVRNWIDQGSLPALRVGRRVRIRQSDLEQLLDAGSIAPAANTKQAEGPSAEDFWGGGPVGLADGQFEVADGDRQLDAVDGQGEVAGNRIGVTGAEPT